LQPEAAEHHDSARHDDGAGFPAVDRPSTDSSRRRATSPDWIVAESSESTVSLPRPRPRKKTRSASILVSSGRRGHLTAPQQPADSTGGVAGWFTAGKKIRRGSLGPR
jgi:hypothetical protein